jgi:hypothetical protein
VIALDFRPPHELGNAMIDRRVIDINSTAPRSCDGTRSPVVKSRSEKAFAANRLCGVHVACSFAFRASIKRSFLTRIASPGCERKTIAPSAPAKASRSASSAQSAKQRREQ